MDPDQGRCPAGFQTQMKPFRRHRLQFRLAILATVVLLWSQFVLAVHPMSAMENPAESAAVQSIATLHDACGEQAPIEQSPVCKVHCSQGGQSDVVGHVPDLPCLPVAALSTSFTTTDVIIRAVRPDARVPVSWHRPTRHPASLLLI